MGEEDDNNHKTLISLESSYLGNLDLDFWDYFKGEFSN